MGHLIRFGWGLYLGHDSHNEKKPNLELWKLHRTVHCPHTHDHNQNTFDMVFTEKSTKNLCSFL